MLSLVKLLTVCCTLVTVVSADSVLLRSLCFLFGPHRLTYITAVVDMHQQSMIQAVARIAGVLGLPLLAGLQH